MNVPTKELQPGEPFEPLLKEILEWGFDGGIRALEAAGLQTWG